MVCNYVTKNEQYDDGVKDCNELLKTDSKNLEALLILTTCLERQRQYDGVEKSATQAIDISDDPATKAHLLVQRGFARTQQRKYGEAGLSEAIAPPVFHGEGDRRESTACLTRRRCLQPTRSNRRGIWGAPIDSRSSKDSQHFLTA